MPRGTLPADTELLGLLGSALRTDTAHVDRLYGLEPVFEPGRDPRQRPMDALIEIECPHCWQSYATGADLTLGTQNYIEDCQLCCHPIEIEVRVINDGCDASVLARRPDEA
jgi:hypothetical protein